MFDDMESTEIRGIQVIQEQNFLEISSNMSDGEIWMS